MKKIRKPVPVYGKMLRKGYIIDSFDVPLKIASIGCYSIDEDEDGKMPITFTNNNSITLYIESEAVYSVLNV